MGKKRKNETEETSKVKNKTSKKDSKKKIKKEASDYEDSEEETSPKKHEEVEVQLPSNEVMLKLLDRIEAQLPKEDHHKYDSRARKLDWTKIAFDELEAASCQKVWFFIQERIRRFRTMAELIPDARNWIYQPWTNFYKSKDANRHPEMPKKPLSMYMLYYSEMREEVLKTNPKLSMPEVAKICSEKYQKLSDKKKNRYKMRCNDMRREYEEKLENFYRKYPYLRPVKPEKHKSNANTQHQSMTIGTSMATGPTITFDPNLIQTSVATAVPVQPQYVPIPQQHQVVATISPPVGQMTGFQLEMPQQSQQYIQPQYQQFQQQPQQQQQQQIMQQQQPTQVHQVQQVMKHDDHNKASNASLFPNAPERPPKPYELYFQAQVEERVNQPGFDRQSLADSCRNEWKTMKLKKKAKWIRKAADLYRKYEEEVAAFQEQNPTYIPPDRKNFLTQEDQKLLDKFMGRPEKPPSSAYSLFSKEMLNNADIKQYPSKERMAQISERWKLVPQDQRDKYQALVNESMGVYRQKYENWFSSLSEEERKAEAARTNTAKHKKPAALANQAMGVKFSKAQQSSAGHVQTPVSYTVTPSGSMVNMQPQQIIVQQQQQPQQHFQSQTTATTRDVNKLREDILKREPVEPARSPKQLFVADYLSKNKKKKPEQAKEAWKNLDKKAKKKWAEQLEPQRQKYIDEYTVFVRGLDKEELELYTELKTKRDAEEEARRQNESSDSEDSDSSDSESESDSDSESD